MRIQSTRFGELDVADDVILVFPHGLPGFAEETEFALLPYQPDSPFAFLQSVKDADLTFILVDPFAFFGDYVFELEDQTTTQLGISNENPPQIYSVLTMPENMAEMTANLVAPVVVNWREHRAAQIVLENTPYTTRHRLFPDGLPQPQKGGA